MQRSICLILIFCYSLLNAAEFDIVEIAKETRHGCQNREAAYRKAMEILPLYGNGNDLFLAVQQILEQACLLDKGRVVPIANTPLAGNSSDPVFLLLDAKDKLVVVVKAFEYLDSSKGGFLKEITSLDFMAQHSELEIAVPAIIATGKTYAEDKWFGLLVQGAAQGRRVDSYLDDALKNAQGEERQRKLQELEKLVLTAAEAFSRLNRTGEPRYQTITPKMIERVRKKLANLEGEAIDFVALTELVEEIIAVTENIPFLAGYAHKSTNLANIFYEAETGQIWYIDVAKFHGSFDLQERPISFSAYDLVRFIEALRKKSINQLSNEEMDHLNDVAVQRYLECSEDPNAALLVNFLSLNSNLCKLGNHFEYLKGSDERKKANSEKLIAMLKRQLKQKTHSQ